MPIYEYQCKDCGHQFDVLQKMSDEPLRDCPECMEPALTKLVSAPSFRLSGSGWYETDFKTDNDKKKNLTDAGKKVEAQSDKKPGKVAGDADSKKEKSAPKTEKSKKAEKNNSSSNAA